jgi:hypothetical protein
MTALIIEIEINKEGSKLSYLCKEDGGGYRIAGPKPWGGSRALAKIKVDSDDLIAGLKHCGVNVALVSS